MTNDNLKENTINDLLKELSTVSTLISEGLEMLDGHVDSSGAGTFLIVALKREATKLLTMRDDIEAALEKRTNDRKAA